MQDNGNEIDEIRENIKELIEKLECLSNQQKLDTNEIKHKIYVDKLDLFNKLVFFIGIPIIMIVFSIVMIIMKLS